MRLICGLWNIGGQPVSRYTVEALCEAMQSPIFPGEIQVWTDGPIGLGLLTFREDAGPLALRDGRVTLADVRLDEGSDLRLSRKLPATFSDADTLAALDLERDAPDVLGDFVVAQWNAAPNRLLLARDALGVRPLCYAHQPGKYVAFASLPSGIFASGVVQRSLDLGSLARELVNLPDTGGTLFAGLKNVPPGHTIAFTSAGEQARRYWRPQPQPAIRGTREEAAVQLRALIKNAVTSCLGSTGPVAAHLSGGLDSSAIAVLASRALQAQSRHLLAYSFLSETWPGLHIEGERPYVDAVLKQEPAIRWQDITAVFSPDWLCDQWNADAPQPLSHGAPENAVCFHAGSLGAGTVLSGWGGDEGITFNGRGAFAASFRRGRWTHLLREMRHMRQERGFRLRNMLAGEVFGPLVSQRTARSLRRLAKRQHAKPLTMRDFLAPDLVQMSAGLEPVEIVANPAEIQARLLAAGHLSFRAARFATLAARYGMAFRFPLLNRRVVEFALAMPPAWHIHAGWKRRLFREAMEGVLPPAVQWRHSKFRSLPRVPYQFASQRERVLHRVEELAANPVVAKLFRMEAAAEVLRALPAPETVQDPAAHPALAALPLLAQLLDYAFYIEQQFPA